VLNLLEAVLQQQQLMELLTLELAVVVLFMEVLPQELVALVVVL
jgi:hypothetical protein